MEVNRQRVLDDRRREGYLEMRGRTRRMGQIENEKNHGFTPREIGGVCDTHGKKNGRLWCKRRLILMWALTKPNGCVLDRSRSA
jgi:hypothetical protein